MNFRDELNDLIKTPEQAAKKQRDESVENGIYWAKYDYEGLKKEIKERASKGKYSIKDGKRVISFHYYDVYVRHLLSIRAARYENVYGIEMERGIRYFPNDEILIDTYIKEMKKLSSMDEIEVKLVGVYNRGGIKKEFAVPGSFGTYDKGINSTSQFDIKVCLLCSLEL